VARLDAETPEGVSAMKITSTSLAGVLVVEPVVHRDARGFFVETYQAARYREHGIRTPFVQANHSKSTRGTLRGLHWQTGAHPQAKLVRVVAGEVFDVAVDIRPESRTFGDWVGVTLSAENFCQLYIPPGYAHGFCVVSEVAELEYQCSDIYDPASERGLMWNDPDVNIPWPVDAPLLSSRDQHHPTLADLRRREAA
jgi:dTDP-4-dehydrorhamnose 3,5-epimerase